MNNLKLAFFGFLSGYIYCFLTVTLQAAFTHLGYPVSFISTMVFALLPYSFKFLWSGFADSVDKSSIKFLISIFIILISFSFFLLILFSDLYSIVFIIMLINLAFLGACFDILTDANLIKNFTDEERSSLLSYYIFGWRIASIFAGGAVLFIFNKIFQGSLSHLFVFSSLIFLILFIVFTVNKLSDFWKFSRENLFYFLMFLPPISLFFIVKTSLYNLKDSFSVLSDISKLFFYSTFYKLFDLTLSSFVIIFFIKKFELTLEFFGVVNTILPLLAVVFCGYAWGRMSSKFPANYIMLFSLLLKSLTLLFFIYVSFYNEINKVYLLVLFSLNIVSSSFVTYSFSNYLMQAVNSARSSFKFSILTSLSMLLILVSVPVASYLVDNYNWISFFTFIFALQVLSYISVFKIK